MPTVWFYIKVVFSLITWSEIRLLDAFTGKYFNGTCTSMPKKAITGMGFYSLGVNKTPYVVAVNMKQISLLDKVSLD